MTKSGGILEVLTCGKKKKNAVSFVEIDEKIGLKHLCSGIWFKQFPEVVLQTEECIWQVWSRQMMGGGKDQYY